MPLTLAKSLPSSIQFTYFLMHVSQSLVSTLIRRCSTRSTFSFLDHRKGKRVEIPVLDARFGDLTSDLVVLTEIISDLLLLVLFATRKYLLQNSLKWSRYLYDEPLIEPQTFYNNSYGNLELNLLLKVMLLWNISSFAIYGLPELIDIFLMNVH